MRAGTQAFGLIGYHISSAKCTTCWLTLVVAPVMDEGLATKLICDSWQLFVLLANCNYCHILNCNSNSGLATTIIYGITSGCN
jgi:hypothetical protein